MDNKNKENIRSNRPLIKVENLTYEYLQDEGEEPIKALNGVNLEIEEGSFVAIIGKNGSGKSTLAKNLNGLLLPTQGEVFVDGYSTRDEKHIWDIRQRAGMVFQNPDNQLVSSTIEDDVAFGPENLGLDREEIRKRVDDSLKAVGMYDYRIKSPHHLSGGQKQRIAIAGVIAMKPRCIIFDEPTAMLDPQGRKDVIRIMEELNKAGITIILITHFMEEAIKSDRIIIMDKGKVFLDEKPEKIFENKEKLKEVDLKLPKVIEVANFLREKGIDVPFNIIERKDMVNFVCQSR